MTEIFEKYMDKSGKMFPWLKELWAWEAERKANGGPEFHEALSSDLPLPKLSLLLECLAAIRENPDLMEKIKYIAFADIPEETPEESYEVGHLVGLFLAWFELKRARGSGRLELPPMLRVAHCSLKRILVEQEMGALRCPDADVIRQEVPAGFFIDDIKNAHK